MVYEPGITVKSVRIAGHKGIVIGTHDPSERTPWFADEPQRSTAHFCEIIKIKQHERQGGE